MFKFLFLEVIFFINFIYLLPILKSVNAHVNSAFVEHLVCYLFIVSAPFFFFFWLTLSSTFLTLTFLPLIYKQTEMVCFVFYSYFIWSYLFVGLIGQPPNLLIDMNEHKHRIQVRDKKQKRKKKKEKKRKKNQPWPNW